MARDLIDDRFGRFREIPLALVRLGHDVQGLCLSYQQRPEEVTIDRSEPDGAEVRWRSLNAGAFKLPGLIKFIQAARRAVDEIRPDVVWACSDSFYGIIGDALSRRSGTSCVFDLYDNFESYGSTKIPGVLALYRRTVARVAGLSCISRPLADHVRQSYGRSKPTVVLENAVADRIFYPRDKLECRRALGLPANARIIGTAGALDRSRGIDVLFKGFTALAEQHGDINLAVAGPRRDQSLIPTGPRVHDLGVLPLDRVALLINALDVAVVCNLDSSFGRFCFPQKAYEIMACRVPVVAASVGAMRDLLAPVGDSLFEVGNVSGLVRVVESQLDHPRIASLDPPSWDEMARRLEVFIQRDMGLSKSGGVGDRAGP